MLVVCRDGLRVHLWACPGVSAGPEDPRRSPIWVKNAGIVVGPQYALALTYRVSAHPAVGALRRQVGTAQRRRTTGFGVTSEVACARSAPRVLRPPALLERGDDGLVEHQLPGRARDPDNQRRHLVWRQRLGGRRRLAPSR